MSRKPLVIWFDDKGNMLSHGYGGHPQYAAQNNYKSEEAKDFDDILEFSDIYDYARGAARVHFVSIGSGRKYSMFVDEFSKLIKAKQFITNRVEGTFRFVKRGTAQSIKLVLPEDNK